MNPNASSFTPRFGAQAQQTQPKQEPPTQTQTQPKQEPQKVETTTQPQVTMDWEQMEEAAKEEDKILAQEMQKATITPTQSPSIATLKSTTTTDDDFGEDGEAGELMFEKDDPREHLNIVFIGHVDAGKSTISGNILYMTGMVDERTIQKYEREAKEKNRDSWFLAYIMDTNEEERAKGKTVEVGRASFETAKKRYTILDAPGHKNYVPNMISGAAQADVGVLIISARKGEFETGFHRAGQTREHTMLAKTLGLKTIIVVINKMDDPTVEWSKERYDQIVNELSPFLKQVGYNPAADVTFVPISGIKGLNLKDPLPSNVCPWFKGPSLLQVLDEMKPLDRLTGVPLRIPVIDKYRDRGATVVLGKVESGSVSKGDQVVIMPGKIPAEVLGCMIDEQRSVRTARSGENIKLYLKGVDEEAVHKGFVVCDSKTPVPTPTRFEAQLAILELLPLKPIFSAGYSAVMHIHTAVEECSVVILLAQLDKKTGAVVAKKPMFVKNGQVVRAIIECAQPVCAELFSDNPQLGRFTLRDEGKTIAIGKVTTIAKKNKQPNSNAN
mmetsp:Transcript_21612/g.30209  ORF Transcript_21612/g.30209 Transcript_21612/m.30209 type:complete len:555 (-) Transcript_21612:140-1804(-)